MFKRLFAFIVVVTAIFSISSCTEKIDNSEDKVWAWVSGSIKMSDEKMEEYFINCKECGIDAIIMECHGAKPAILDSTTFRDDAAIEIISRAAQFAKKYDITLGFGQPTAQRGPFAKHILSGIKLMHRENLASTLNSITENTTDGFVHLILKLQSI